MFDHVPFGYSFFSTLHGNSRIAAHSAPMNLRIRLHLPLIVPETLGHQKVESVNNCLVYLLVEFEWVQSHASGSLAAPCYWTIPTSIKCGMKPIPPGCCCGWICGIPTSRHTNGRILWPFLITPRNKEGGHDGFVKHYRK